MNNIYMFPSVLEGNNTELKSVADDLINGMKLFINGGAYIIGNLALTEGISPHKIINSSPDDLDYQLLLSAGLLLANFNNNRAAYLTTGFPFSTYQINRQVAKDYIKRLHSIRYDASPFSNKTGADKMHVQVSDVDILPEMMGNIIALRKGEYEARGDFFIVSLGFGTCEAVVSTENGIVQRTTTSTYGMQYAIDLLINELSRSHYLGLKNKRQVDIAFQRNYIVLNRKKIDITDLKKKVLHNYYHDVISPALRNAFKDSDFEKASKFFITGGGALYSDLTDEFYQEFSDIVDVEVVENPLTLTAKGYCLHSLELANGDKSLALGLDIGNANTVLAQFDEGTFGWQ